MITLVDEYCNHCETEVQIQNHLKSQKCPNCRVQIRPCSVRYDNPIKADACDGRCEACITETN